MMLMKLQIIFFNALLGSCTIRSEQNDVDEITNHLSMMLICRRQLLALFCKGHAAITVFGLK